MRRRLVWLSSEAMADMEIWYASEFDGPKDQAPPMQTVETNLGTAKRLVFNMFGEEDMELLYLKDKSLTGKANDGGIEIIDEPVDLEVL